MIASSYSQDAIHFAFRLTIITSFDNKHDNFQFNMSVNSNDDVKTNFAVTSVSEATDEQVTNFIVIMTFINNVNDELKINSYMQYNDDNITDAD